MFWKEKIGQLFCSQRHFAGKFSVNSQKGYRHWASQYHIQIQHYLFYIPFFAAFDMSSSEDNLAFSCLLS